MKKKTSLFLAIAMIASLILSGCGSSGTKAAGSGAASSGAAGSSGKPEYVMKLCTATSNDRQAESLELMKQYIETNSNGRISVETYPAGQMGSATQVHQLLLANEVQGLCEPTAFMVGFCDALTMLDIPFLFDYDKITLQQISDIFNSDVLDPVRKEAADSGLYIAGINEMTYRMVMTKFPVDSIDDFKGVKVRCGNSLLQEEWKALGATGIIISVPELYTSLQQGTVTAHESDYNFFNSGKYYEVAPYLVDLPLGTQNSVHLFNQEWIDSLPVDLQQVVYDASASVRDHFQQGTWADVEKYRNETWPQLGVTFCKVSDQMADEMKEKTASVGQGFLTQHPELKDCYNAIQDAAQQYYNS